MGRIVGILDQYSFVYHSIYLEAQAQSDPIAFLTGDAEWSWDEFLIKNGHGDLRRRLAHDESFAKDFWQIFDTLYRTRLEQTG